MAGKRQHYIPQFLLKGFASRTSGKETFVWAYKKAQPPFEANTKNIALENHFYGSPTETSLDLEITNLEGNFGEMLRKSRTVADRLDISETCVAEFVTNMSVRHKYLRFGMIESVNWLFDEVERFYGIPGNGEAFTKNYLRKNPQVLKQAMEEALFKVPLPPAQKAAVRAKILAMPASDLINLSATFFQSALGDFKTDILPKMRANMADVMKASHIKALAKSLVSTPRLNALKDLHWIVVVTKEPLILGDVCILFEVEGYDSWLPLAGAADKVLNVYLPIATNRIIVGSRGEAPLIDPNQLNSKFATQSMEFFISSQNGSNEDKLRDLIGTNSRLFSDEQLKQIVAESISADLF